MVVCYGRIGFVLWGKGTQDDEHAASNDLAVQRKLIAKRNVRFNKILLEAPNS